jgi:hypothetical protein
MISFVLLFLAISPIANILAIDEQPIDLSTILKVRNGILRLSITTLSITA